MACTEIAEPRYSLEEVSAVRDAAGRLEVHGVVHNRGGPPDSSLCVRVECFGALATPQEGAAGSLPDEDEATDLLIDAQERCYADGVSEGGTLSVAITMGEATAARPEQRGGDAPGVRRCFARRDLTQRIPVPLPGQPSDFLQ